MKRIVVLGLGVLILIVGVSLGLTLNKSLAQEKVNFETFAGVYPFYTTGGYFGFFDQKEGKVYIYDELMKKCLFQYKLVKLGESAVDLYEDVGLSGTAEVYGQVYVVSPEGELEEASEEEIQEIQEESEE